ncbi:hypothetical protein GCM10018965_001100 [Nonomuraea roseola]
MSEVVCTPPCRAQTLRWCCCGSAVGDPPKQQADEAGTSGLSGASGKAIPMVRRRRRMPGERRRGEEKALWGAGVSVLVMPRITSSAPTGLKVCRMGPDL